MLFIFGWKLFLYHKGLVEFFLVIKCSLLKFKVLITIFELVLGAHENKFEANS